MTTSAFIKRASCPVCGSKQIEEFLNIPYDEIKLSKFITTYYKNRIPRSIFKNEQYVIHYCTICSLTYQAHILNPEYMQQLYDKWICPKESLEKKLNTKNNSILTYTNESKLISSLIKKPNKLIKVLDYGMGWGHWLNVAKSFEFRTTGVEISEPRKEYAIKNGHRVLSDINNDEKYDFIYANQVFEHIPDPSRSINELSNALSPEGVILLSVPQGRKYTKISSFKNYQPKKDALHPLEHINCFNRNSLKILGNSTGLRPIQPPLSVLSSSLSNFPKSCLRYIYDITLSTKLLFRNF